MVLAIVPKMLVMIAMIVVQHLIPALMTIQEDTHTLVLEELVEPTRQTQIVDQHLILVLLFVQEDTHTLVLEELVEPTRQTRTAAQIPLVLEELVLEAITVPLANAKILQQFVANGVMRLVGVITGQKLLAKIEILLQICAHNHQVVAQTTHGCLLQQNVVAMMEEVLICLRIVGAVIQLVCLVIQSIITT
jgi:hypothetical protein